MRAIIYFVIAASCWGLNFHLAKVMLSQVSFVEAGFWRYLFGVGALWAVSRYQALPLRSLDRKHIFSKGVLLVGIIGLFGFNLLFFLGLQYTTALNAALIVSMNPVLTLIFAAWLLKEPIRQRQYGGIAVALTGVLLLLSKGQPAQLLRLEWALGDLLILAANAVFALHHIWVRKYATQLANSTFTFLTNAICLLGFVLLLPVVGVQAPASGDMNFWLAALGIGIPGTALAYLLWNKGVGLAGAGNAGFYMNVVPMAAAIFAVFFGEQLMTYHFTSGALIVAGMIWLNRSKSEKTKRKIA